MKKLKPVSKKKTKTKIILMVNTLIKIGLAIAFIFLFNIQIKNYGQFKKLYNGYYEPWKEANNYVTLNLQGGDPDVFDSDDFYKKQEKLYKKFNADGAIVSEFTMCKTPSKDRKYRIKYFKRHGTINPNYLKKHSIYDSKGEKISISEKNKNWVILIPDKFKKDEKEIRKLYQSTNNYLENHKKGEIEIIWTKPDQKYFSYNTSVNPKEGNYVKDPIVLVGTEEGLYPQWSSIIFNIEGNPVKVRVDKNIPLDDQIEPYLESVGIKPLGLKINLINEKAMANHIKYENLLQSLVIKNIFIFVVLIFTLARSISNFFKGYSNKISLRDSCGHKSFFKYKEYLKIITISWILIGIISIALKKASINIVLIITLSGFIIESLISIRFLDLMNKKTLTESIK